MRSGPSLRHWAGECAVLRGPLLSFCLIVGLQWGTLLLSLTSPEPPSKFWGVQYPQRILLQSIVLPASPGTLGPLMGPLNCHESGRPFPSFSLSNWSWPLPPAQILAGCPCPVGSTQRHKRPGLCQPHSLAPLEVPACQAAKLVPLEASQG